MALWRIFTVCSLVLVLLPWGALANAFAPLDGAQQNGQQPAGHMAQDSIAVLSVASETDGITGKPKRCRIAFLAGISCVADSVGHRATAFGAVGQPVRNPYFVQVILPRGVSTSVHLDPPRHS